MSGSRPHARGAHSPLGWRPARPRPAERAPTSRPVEDGPGLTGGDPGGLGVVPVLDAGDQLAAVLQRVPTDQRGLAPATPGRAKASGGKAKLRQDALLPLRSVCSRSRAPEGTRGRCTQQPGACGAPTGQTGVRCSPPSHEHTTLGGKDKERV